MSKKGYSIGAVSKETSVHIETIRYYERIGLIPEPDRTAGGNRQYDFEQLRRLSFVKRCRELDFSIDEIRSLLKMTDSQNYTCADVHEVTVSHLDKVKAKIADLQRMQSLLEAMAKECSCGDVPDCPIVDTLLLDA